MQLWGGKEGIIKSNLSLRLDWQDDTSLLLVRHVQNNAKWFFSCMWIFCILYWFKLNILKIEFFAKGRKTEWEQMCCCSEILCTVVQGNPPLIYLLCIGKRKVSSKCLCSCFLYIECWSPCLCFCIANKAVICLKCALFFHFCSMQYAKNNSKE